MVKIKAIEQSIAYVEGTILASNLVVITNLLLRWGTFMTKTRSTYFGVLAFLASPLAANADLIEITDTGLYDGTWDITLVEGSFNNLAADLMDQDWWKDETLAFLLANTLGDSMGIPNAPWGPFFSFDDTYKNDILINTMVSAWNTDLDPSMASLVRASPTRTFGWATGTRITVSEPGTIGLLAIGLIGLGLVGRRRKT